MADTAALRACEAVRRLRTMVMRPVRTQLAGTYASAFAGAGIEFAAHRPYAVGDDVRRMDWALTTRLRQPYIRAYVAERGMRVLLLFDVSRSLTCTPEGTGPRDRACVVAAALALSAAWRGDRVGAILFAGDVVAAVPPRGGEKHALEVVRQCLTVPTRHRWTDLAPALRRVVGMKGHAAVFIVSDFLCTPPVWSTAVCRLLQACAVKHETRAACLSPALPGRHRAVLTAADAESGRPRDLDLGGRSGLRVSQLAERRTQGLARAFGSSGIPWAEVPPGADWAAALQGLLRQRPWRAPSARRP